LFELNQPHLLSLALLNCAGLVSAKALSVAVFSCDLELRLGRLDFRGPVGAELCASLGGLTRSSGVPGSWAERALLLIVSPR